jgi:hypothetical protein
MQTDTYKALCKLLQGDYRSESSIQLVKRVEGLVKALRTERDELRGTINGLKQLVELPESAGLTELFNAVEALELKKSEQDDAVRSLKSAEFTNNGMCKAMEQTARVEELLAELHDTATLLLNNNAMDTNVLTSVHKLLARPDTTQPQLNEIRYVLHGDIQPCTVLYSDDTTTLLRLDEGDIMCETDTIEWSDSVTYRCQELLKLVDVRSSGRVAPLLAQLVRDERIVLNDESPVDSDEVFTTQPMVARAPMQRPQER